MENLPTISSIYSKIEFLNRKYNPEHDLIPNTPMVTYADGYLLQIVESLTKRLEYLEGIVDGLQND